MIDPSADRAVYRQVADALRTAILSGQVPPGRRLPSETDIGQEYGVGRSTARRALTVLRQEGLAVTIVGYGTVAARRDEDPEVVTAHAGDEIVARRASDDERRRMELPEGAPLLVIRRDGGAEELHAADSVIIHVEA